MSRLTGSLTATQPSTTHVRSLVIRLDGITAGDYLAWVRDPEPPPLDRALRSVATSADPLGELVNVELVWAGQPPTTPSKAAVAAGFALTPEVVAVHSAIATPTSTAHSRLAHGMLAPSESAAPSPRAPNARLARGADPNDAMRAHPPDADSDRTPEQPPKDVET